MTKLKQQAVEMIQDVPDDKMSYVIDMLKWINSLLNDKNPVAPGNVDDVFDAWEGFKKYKGIVHFDIDEKLELAKARDEKHANFD